MVRVGILIFHLVHRKSTLPVLRLRTNGEVNSKYNMSPFVTCITLVKTRICHCYNYLTSNLEKLWGEYWDYQSLRG